MTRTIACLAACALMLCSCDFVHQMMDSTIDFESVEAPYLAGPTSYGANLYSVYDGMNQFKSVTVDGIVFGINESNALYDFYNGGVCISQFNDMAGDTYENQCSVYYSQSKTGKGGHKGSETFAVATGYYSDYAKGASIYFLEDDATATFKSVMVTNTTYTYMCMKNGNAFCRKFSVDNKDFLKIVATGYTPAGAKTGTAEFYLADFRTSASAGIVDSWTEFDLSGLGSCHKITFDIQGSDTGAYGLNTPAYFAFDDLKYKKD